MPFPGITLANASSEETGKASLTLHPVTGLTVVAGCSICRLD